MWGNGKCASENLKKKPADSWKGVMNANNQKKNIDLKKSRLSIFKEKIDAL